MLQNEKVRRRVLTMKFVECLYNDNGHFAIIMEGLSFSHSVGRYLIQVVMIVTNVQERYLSVCNIVLVVAAGVYLIFRWAKGSNAHAIKENLIFVG